MAQNPLLDNFGDKNTKTWIIGDLHAYNFGTFLNNKGEIVYDVNDFDDAIIADYQYDLWRLATSMVMIAKDNASLNNRDLEKSVRNLTLTYIDTLSTFLDLAQKDTCYITYENSGGNLRKFLLKTERKNNRPKMLRKWVKVKKGLNKFNFKNNSLRPVSEEQEQIILNAFPDYVDSLEAKFIDKSSYFKIIDIAQRLSAGLGSLGCNRFYVLIQGDSKKLSDDRIIDLKFQWKPTGYFFLSVEEQKEYDKRFENEGIRFVEAYKSMHRYSDNHLGWIKLPDGYYTVTERCPYRGYFPPEKLKRTKDFENMAADWARSLASNHVYSFNDFNYELVIEKAYQKRRQFFEQIMDLAFAYERQVVKDWEMFCDILKKTNKS